MLTEEQLETDSTLHEDLTEIYPNVLAEAERLLAEAGRPISFEYEFPNETIGFLVIDRVSEGTTLREVVNSAADTLINLMKQRLKGHPHAKLDPKGTAERKAKIESARASRQALREAVRRGLDEDDEQMRAAVKRRREEHRAAVAADLAELLEVSNE